MKTVYVLGAGVDIPLGLPLADDLLEELHRFVANEGSDLDKTLRRRLGRFRFSFREGLNKSRLWMQQIIVI